MTWARYTSLKSLPSPNTECHNPLPDCFFCFVLLTGCKHPKQLTHQCHRISIYCQHKIKQNRYSQLKWCKVKRTHSVTRNYCMVSMLNNNKSSMCLVSGWAPSAAECAGSLKSLLPMGTTLKVQVHGGPEKASSATSEPTQPCPWMTMKMVTFATEFEGRTPPPHGPKPKTVMVGMGGMNLPQYIMDC